MTLKARVTAARNDLRNRIAALDEVDAVLLGAPGSSAEVAAGQTVVFMPPPSLSPVPSRGIRREYAVEQQMIVLRLIGGRLAADVEAASEACAQAALAICDDREQSITLDGGATRYDPPRFEHGQAMQIPANTGEMFAAHPGAAELQMVDTPERGA